MEHICVCGSVFVCVCVDLCVSEKEKEGERKVLGNEYHPVAAEVLIEIRSHDYAPISPKPRP